MLHLQPPNETQLEHIKKEECYKSADIVEEDVTQLIEWLSKQPHLPKITDRKWLTNFIIGCKYNLQRTKQVIESYFIARAEYPEFFSSYTKEKLDQAAKYGKISIFPKLTPEGYRVNCCGTLPTTDDDKFDVEMFCKMSLVALDLQLKEEPSHGLIFLFDLKHIKLSQFLAFTPTVTKNFLKCCIDAFPMRVKAVHYINPPKFISRLITFFKMFLSNKIKDRIFVHDNLEDVFEFIPRDVMPDVYGGTGGDIYKLEDDFINVVLENQEIMANRPKADLSKRPEQSKTDELDMNGTFKKLQID